MAESFGYVNVLGWSNHNHSSQANCTAFFGMYEMYDVYCVMHELFNHTFNLLLPLFLEANSRLCSKQSLAK